MKPSRILLACLLPVFFFMVGKSQKSRKLSAHKFTKSNLPGKWQGSLTYMRETGEGTTSVAEISMAIAFTEFQNQSVKAQLFTFDKWNADSTTAYKKADSMNLGL